MSDDVSIEFTVVTNLKEEVQQPPKFNVVMRDFSGLASNCSVSILMDVFGLHTYDAQKLTDEAALNGRSVVATYPKDTAKLKAHQARNELSEHKVHNQFMQLMRFRCEREF